MLKKPTYLRWLMALTIGIFLWSGNTLSAQDGGREIGNSVVNGITAYYESGASNVVLEFETIAESSDFEYVIYATLDFPAGITVLSFTDMETAGSNYLEANGETGDGATLSWGTSGSYAWPAYLWNTTATFTVTVDINPGFTGDLDIDWYLEGDGWGSAPHNVSGTITIEELTTDPGLELLTTHLDLGERPIGAWQKPGVFELINNPGKGAVTITNLEIDDNTGFVQLVNPVLPYVLGEGETLEVGLTTTDEVVGDGDTFDGTFAIIHDDGRALITGTYEAVAYEPDMGDVWEVAFDGNGTGFPVNVAEADFRNNYELPGDNDDGWDNVYEFTFNDDFIVDVSLTADDPKMAFYAPGFGGMGGPDVGNALVEAEDLVLGLEVFAGTYFLVVSTTGPNYILDIDGIMMPMPDDPAYIAPADGAIDIVNGDQLEWAWGANTLEYQVVLGTTYPPATIVQDWTLADTDVNGTYTLTDLNPNLQYFWKVNVRNNNATNDMTPVWGFTTTITPPSGLTAQVLDGGVSQPTVNVALEWDSPLDGRAFLHYNVYRDGVEIATEVMSESYSDNGVARASTFDYHVTAVFDEGESAPSNIATVNTRGVGTFNGFVFEFLSGDPIEGASVNITGPEGTYNLTTAANGAYTTLAYAGTYNITANADGFTPETIAGEVLTHSATVSNNFNLWEVPYPVATVEAFELNENSVQISWDGSGPEPPAPVVEEWLIYDADNQTFHGIGAQALDYSLIWASRWVPDQLIAYAPGFVTKVSVYQMTNVGDYVTEVRVMSGDGTNVLYAQDVTGELLEDAWTIVDLDEAVPFDNTEDLWIGMYVERPGGTFNEPTSAALATHTDRYDYFAYNGGPWTTINGTYGVVGHAWMLRGYVTTDGGREIALGTGDYEIRDRRDYSNMPSQPSGQALIPVKEANTKFPQYVDENTRGILSYDVWREKVYQPGTLELIGNTIQQNFVDFDWGVQDWGVYRWAVTVNYDAGQVSTPTFSNTLDKDMYAEVDVTVTTNSGDSPAGTLVTFENTSEPDLELIYDVTLDGSGTFLWNMFRKGVYDIHVQKLGFEPVAMMDVEIFDDESFSWLLIEILAIPTDLYVTPTALATWSPGVAGPGADFEPFIYSFEDAVVGFDLPDGWTKDPVTNNWQIVENHWGGTAGGDGPEMMFNWTPSGTNQFYAISPAINTAGQNQLMFSFKQYVNDFNGNYDLRVVAIADGVEYIIEEWPAPNATMPADTYMYTLTSADHGVGAADFHLAWVFDGNSFNINRWYIDDISLTAPARSEASRQLVNYKVFLDGALIAETTDEFYQHDVSTLVDGQVYESQVAAVYSTGQSELTNVFEWTYIACDNYDAPGNFVAEQVIGTTDVALSWTIPTVAGDQIDFTRIYRDGVIIAEVDSDMYLDADLAFGTYNYCLTFIYDSGAETCVGAVCASVEVTGGAFVDGTVVQAAYLGGAPVQGAEVIIYNDDNSFTFFTNAAGIYEGEVIAGTYNYEVNAGGYISEMLAGVDIPEASTVTQDFELMEFPEAVRDVVAVELTDNTVEISWRTPGFIPFDPFIEDFSGGIADWTRVPDLANWQLSQTSLAGGASPEVRFYFSPSAINTWYFISPMMSTLTQAELELEFKHFLSHFGGPYTLSVVTIADGEEHLVHEWVNPTGWGAQTFSTTLTAAEHGVGADEFQIAFIFDGDSWNVNNWNIDDIMLYMPGSLALATNEDGTQEYMSLRQPESTLAGYNLYRTSCEDGGDLQFLGFTLDSIFNDNTWGTAASGVYKWGVEAVYEANMAEVIFSNCLDKDMLTTVSVNVVTNSGDSPEGTDVWFMNTSEPDLELVYEAELDETGFFAWDDFRKGTYDVYVELLGFIPIELMDVVIDGPTNFSWVLEEMLSPVSDLHVTPTALATWSPGGVVPFADYHQDFNDGLPETWTVEVGGTTADTWHWTAAYAGSTLDGTPFMFVDSDAAGLGGVIVDEMLYSPVVDASTAAELHLMFEQYYRHLGAGSFGKVEVFDGADWVTVLNQTATAGTWTASNFQTIDVTEYANNAFQVRFHYFDNGAWAWYWAVDNVSIVEDPAGDRAVVGYKVWLDGIHKADTPNTYFQYDVDELVEGQTYLSEVAVMYTTGMSAKMEYEWTYMACENFPGPDDLTAEVVNETDVVLNWGEPAPPPPPGGEWYEISYHNGIPSNAFYQSFNNGYGVVFDLNAYSNVSVELLDFRHSPWGIFGTWDYKLHVVDWDTYTLVHTTEVLESTVNDGWELDIPLGSLELDGLVGVFLEPMGHLATDAYPCLDGDQMTTTNSFYGPLPNWSGMSNAGTVGNFLMDLWILADPLRGGERELVKAPVLEAGETAHNASRGTAEPVASQAPANSFSDYSPLTTAYSDKPSRDLYDLIYSFPVGVGGGEYSVATDGEYIYTAAWNSTNFYRYELDGTYIGSFTISGAGNLRDMTYDGEYFYGSPNSTTIYQLDLANETLVGTISAPNAVRGIAYDADNDAFWVTNGWSPPLSLVSRTGTVLETLNTTAASFSGLGYDNVSDGGPYLWGHNQPASNNILTKIDMTSGATIETFDVATVAPVGGGISGGMDITNLLVEDMWTFLGTAQNEIIWVIELLEDENGGGTPPPGGGDWEYLGANIYRNGVLIAEQVPGDTYTDFDLLPGDYEYCVTFVYEDGAESCYGENCVDVTITCEAPINLVGEYLWMDDDEFGAMIEWEPATPPVGPVAEWLYYDDGINVDGIGGPASFTWAIKFDPAQLEEFDGASLTKIEIYNRLASTDELRIYEGTNAATLLHSQPLAGLPVEAWSEVELDSPVLLDVSKQLWIAVYTTDGVNFPAACGNGMGEPNGDLITLDGVLWEHLTDFGLIYTWNLRGFVTTMTGVTAALPMDKPADTYESNPASLAISGDGPGANNVLESSSTRELMMYNVYRKHEDATEYSLIATVPFDPDAESYMYYDTDVEAQQGYHYQVTAYHEYEGDITCESAPAFALDNPEEDFVYVFITNIHAQEVVATRMYPNPANSELNIEAPAMQRITIVNAVGQVVYDVQANNQSKHSLNVSAFEAGVYVVRIATATGMEMKRVTIVR